MQTEGNTILITGGASGIGFAMAEAFTSAGNEVLICGRTQQKLDVAKQRLPSLHTRACDVSDKNERQELFQWATEEFPALNVLVNNAGIIHPIDLKDGNSAADTVRQELTVDLQAPIQLTMLFLPHLTKQPQAAVVNVGTGLAYAPSAEHPVYCAAKAGLHSFSQSLRHQLKGTSVEAFEVLPPPVDTEMNTSDDSKIAPEKVAQATLSGMGKGRGEIRIGLSKVLYYISRVSPGAAFWMLNR